MSPTSDDLAFRQIFLFLLSGSLLYAASLFAWCVSDTGAILSVWSAVLFTPLFGLPFMLGIARRHIVLWFYFFVLLPIAHGLAAFTGTVAAAALYSDGDAGSVTFGIGALCGAIGGASAFVLLLSWRFVPKTRAVLIAALAGVVGLAAIGGVSALSVGYAMQILLPAHPGGMDKLDLAFAQVWLHAFWQIAFAYVLALMLVRRAPIDDMTA